MVAVTLAATAAIMAAVVKVTEVLVVMAELWRWSARAGARARSATIRGRISCGCAAVLWFRPEPSGCRIWHVSGRWKCRASPHVKDVPSGRSNKKAKAQRVGVTTTSQGVQIEFTRLDRHRFAVALHEAGRTR